MCTKWLYSYHSSNTLWYSLRWNYNYILIILYRCSLISSKDNILVIRKNKYCLCIDVSYSTKNILCTWVHSLTTLNNIINTKIKEYII